MKKDKFVETYKEWDIYKDKYGHFAIYGDYDGEHIEVTEDTIKDMKLMIDYL